MPPSKVIDQNMAPTKLATLKPAATKMVTRNSGRTSAAATMLKKMNLKDLSKRKADQLSPPKGKTTKRSAFYDITNDVTAAPKALQNAVQPQKQATLPIKKATAKITVTAQPKIPTRVTKTTGSKWSAANDENIDPQQKKPAATVAKAEKTKIEVVTKKETVEVKTKEATKLKVREAAQAVVKQVTIVAEKKEVKVLAEKKEVKKTEVIEVRKSLDTDSSLYSTALETLSTPDESFMVITPIKKEKAKTNVSRLPTGVEDFDKENLADPCQVSDYAMDVFKYLKTREPVYIVKDYMSTQTYINNWMRSLLVDWMVDVQEHFELNHETLYLAVKVMDLYLSKHVVRKETLQLIGCASLFLSSKYDERIPPAIEEFLHVCENIYTREELIHMEMEIFKDIDFCLGMPLSYRFLRRYARCSKVSMPILTLARFILELSLMEYPLVFESESKAAAAALYLALRMKDVSPWTPTLEYYSGYKLQEFVHIAVQLNTMLHKKPKEQLRTVRTKYSHTIFYEVAKVPLIDSAKL